jgi:hypothetical protein
MENKKKQFWKDLWGTLLGKFPYIILGWFFYPFIQRTKVREKIKSGKYNDYTLGLWYMLNDDELKRFDVDYDIGKEGRAKTRLGHNWKSYLFNAIRNGGYNYSLTFNPVIEKYDVVEVEHNSLTRYNPVIEEREKTTPLYWARWTWIQKDGSLNNKGETISPENSILGKGKIWFNPHNGEDVLYLRWSKATQYSFLIWDVYHTFRIGAFGTRYDIVLKNQPAYKPWFKRLLVKLKLKR